MELARRMLQKVGRMRHLLRGCFKWLGGCGISSEDVVLAEGMSQVIGRMSQMVGRISQVIGRMSPMIGRMWH